MQNKTTKTNKTNKTTKRKRTTNYEFIQPNIGKTGNSYRVRKNFGDYYYDESFSDLQEARTFLRSIEKN